MSLIHVAISITMFAAPSPDGTPKTMSVIQKLHPTYESCDQWKKDRYDNPWPMIDPVTGQAVILYLYECAVLDTEREW